MSFDWAEYLDLARELAELRPRNRVTAEAKYRAAISRAYYAAQRKAFLLAHSKDGYRYTRSSLRGSHEDLIYHFQTHGDAVRYNIGTKLDTLRDWRVQADYENRVPNLPRNAELCCIMAQQVLNLLAQIP